jgi:hypothetical protein
MAQIKLLGVRVIRQIKRRILAGEKSNSIASDYGVSSGHIRKIKLGMLDPTNPNGRWGYITLDESDE